MSWVVLGICNKRRFGRASVKQVIMYLADDGDGIWCSKYTVARETELSLATVKRIIREFVRGGILVEMGARDCDHGQTVVYRISLDVVQELPKLKHKKIRRLDATGVVMHPVTDDPSTGVNVSVVKWSGKTGQRAKMYPTLKTGYTNDEETQFFRQV